MPLSRLFSKQQPKPPRRLVGPSSGGGTIDLPQTDDIGGLFTRAQEAMCQGARGTAKELFERVVLAGEPAPPSLEVSILVASSFFGLASLALHDQSYSEASYRFTQSATRFRLATREANKLGQADWADRLASQAAAAEGMAKKLSDRPATSASHLLQMEADLRAQQRESWAYALGRV